MCHVRHTSLSLALLPLTCDSLYRLLRHPLPVHSLRVVPQPCIARCPPLSHAALRPTPIPISVQPALYTTHTPSVPSLRDARPSAACAMVLISFGIFIGARTRRVYVCIYVYSASSRRPYRSYPPEVSFVRCGVAARCVSLKSFMYGRLTPLDTRCTERQRTASVLCRAP